MNYRFVIGQAALRTLLACSTKERRLLLQTFERLAETPFLEPDLKDIVEGREVWTRFFGPFALSYWVDHAVAEVRVILIFRD